MRYKNDMMVNKKGRLFHNNLPKPKHLFLNTKLHIIFIYIR